MSIQPLWLTQFIEIILVLEFQLTKLIVGTFSYKAHFRPQISFNETKLDPSGKKGIFVGYSESLKACRIYFPRFKIIDISMDITFDEYSAYKKSRTRPAEDPEETKVPRIHDTTMNAEIQEED